MPSKWTVEELAPGRTVEAIFWPNTVESSQFKLRATHLDAAAVWQVSDEAVVGEKYDPTERSNNHTDQEGGQYAGIQN